jgi:hypothetical protein
MLAEVNPIDGKNKSQLVIEKPVKYIPTQRMEAMKANQIRIDTVAFMIS